MRWSATTRSVVPRLAMTAVLVLLCHAFDWTLLRQLTTDALVAISHAIGIPMHRLDWDLISIGNVRVRFVVSCTLVDAYCGAIPLLWGIAPGRSESEFVSIKRNLVRLAVLAGAMFCFNLFRLELGFVGLYFGAPWWLAHEVISGLTYFALFLWIVRSWRRYAINLS